MRIIKYFQIIIILIFVAGATVAAQRTNVKSETIAFVEVNVILTGKERVLKNKTVIVSGGRIAKIDEESKIKVPAGALIIDGRS